MRELEQESMEAEGYFFLNLAMVPRSWSARFYSSCPIDPTDYRGPDAIWWRGHEPAVDIRSYCDSKWSRTDPTGWYLCDDVDQVSWSDSENHRVEVTFDRDGELMEFNVLIDIRTAFSDFLDQLIAMAEKTECQFFDYEEEKIVGPSRQWVLDKISKHEMTHVVFDSSGKLAPN